MDKIFSMVVAFIIMINPFGLFLYLSPIMKKLSHRDFIKVLVKASLISFGIYNLFLFSGEFIFKYVFQIRFDSFRIFGGVVLFSFAYFYIVKGQRALLDIKSSLDDLASEIALPFMVGAGSISLTLVISDSYKLITGFGILTMSVLASFMIIVFLKFIHDSLKTEGLKVAFNKNMEILLRLNGFFVGAIGIDMIITGIKKVFFS